MPADKALIDSGPIVALFNRKDSCHHQVLKAINAYQGYLYTTWPVITECMYLLSFSPPAQKNLLEWIQRGALQIENLTLQDVEYLKIKMEKYTDLPMDLADATLMCIAERNHLKYIFSIDSDFSIYKTTKGKNLQNLLN